MIFSISGRPLQQRFLEHAGFHGAFVAVVFVDVPAAEYQIVQIGERNKILDFAGRGLSVRFPSRIVPSWVSEPIGCAIFFLIASTPAINVVLTAPSPGISTPSFPVGLFDLDTFLYHLPP